MDSLQNVSLESVKSLAMQIWLRAAICVVYLAVLCHAIRFLGPPLRDSWRDANLTRACTNLVRSVARFLGFVQVPDGALGAAVRNQLNDFRLRHALSCIQIAAHLYSAGILALALILEFHGTEDETGTAINVSTAGFMLAALLIFAWGWANLTIRWLDVFNALAMCWLLSHLISLENHSIFFIGAGVRVVFRILMGIVYLDYRKSLWWNVVLSAVTCWRYTHNDSVLILNDERATAMKFVVGETFSCSLLVACLYCIEKWIEMRVRVQIVAENQKHASLKLLGFQCQAVFWLTPELNIDGPAPQLAHMLLMEAAPGQLAGRAFERYVAQNGDRERFRTFIETSKVNQGPDVPPAALHMNLRDAYSTNVAVDVFHVHYIDIESRERHLIGIREGAAREAHRHQEEQAQAQHQVHRGLGLPPQAPPSTTDSVPAPSCIGQASEFSMTSAGGPATGEPSQIMITIDVFSETFTISNVEMNRSATDVLNLPGLISLLPASSVDSFAEWVQGRANGALHDMTPAPTDLDAGPLVVKFGEQWQIAAESTFISFHPSFSSGQSATAELKLRGISLLPLDNDPREAQDTTAPFEIVL